MATNGSSGNGGQDPWRRPSNDGPPDLIQLIKKFFHKSPISSVSYRKPTYDAGNVGVLVGIIAVVIIVIWVLLGIFLVDPAEQAVVLRFGKYATTVGPGPHWIPRFIDSEYKVNVQRVDSFPYHSEMLSKDENIVSIKLQVQYRIANPRDYLFNVVDPQKTIQQSVSSALRQMVGQMELDRLITTGRGLLTQQVTEQLQKILGLYQTGIEVVDVALQEVKPPSAVTAAFDDVVKAREDRQSYINKAQAYAKKRVLIASGVASRLQQNANAYSYTVVAKSKGETARYLALLKPYKQSPEVTGKRLYLDTIANVLSKTSNVVISNDLSNNLLYLPLNQMLRHGGSNITPSAQTSSDSGDDAIGLNDTIRQPAAMTEAESSSSSERSKYPERPSYSDDNKGGD